MADGDRFTLSDVQTVTVVSSGAGSNGDVLEVESRWSAGDTKPPGHLHPHQDEHFEVLEGELTARVNGETRVLGPGEVLEVPRGAVHEMWNASGAPCRARWLVRPALATEQFFAALHASRAHRRSRKGGTVTPVGAGRVLHAFPDEFRLAGPAPVGRALAAVLAGVARLRGYPRPRP